MFKDETVSISSAHRSLDILRKLPISQKRDELIAKIELWLNPKSVLIDNKDTSTSSQAKDRTSSVDYWKSYALFLERQGKWSQNDLNRLYRDFNIEYTAKSLQ